MSPEADADSSPFDDDPTREMTSAGGGTPAPQTPRIGKYLIRKKLGQGGMGAVYLAHDEVLNRQVALKVLPRDKAENPTLVRRFKSEAQAAAQLDHPNIIAVHESGEGNGYLYIALEFVDGTDLANMVAKRGVLPVKRSIEVIKQASLALQHAAKHKIVHRDIKPANLMIRRDGQVKLADMGLARIVAEGADTSITRTGTTVGTVDYMSPEQARDSKAADIRSDIYSLGCAWYYLLTGSPPFPDGGVTNKLHAHFKTPFPDPRDKNPQVPEGVSAVMRRMTEKDPARRYQTPDELIADLVVLQEGGDHVSNAILSDTPTPQAKSRKSSRAKQADVIPEGETVEDLSNTAAARRRKKVAASQLPMSTSGPLGTERDAGGAEWKSKLTFYSAVAAVLLTLLSGLWWLALQMNKTVATTDPTLTAEQLAEQREALARQGKTISGAGETQMSPTDPAQGTPEDKNRRVGEGEGEEPGTVAAGPKQVETNETGKRVGGGADTGFFPGSQGGGGAPGAGNKRLREELAALPRWAREPVTVPTKTFVVDPVGSQPGSYRTLNQAFRDLPVEGARIVLVGSGPFAVKTDRIENRGRVVLEAAQPESRPLLVLLEPEGPAVHALLEFHNTSLELQNVHFAVTVTGYDTLPNDAFLHVSGGDFLARGCSFSARGIPEKSMTAVRVTAGDGLVASNPASPAAVSNPPVASPPAGKPAPGSPPIADADVLRQKLLLANCLVRGDKLSAVWSESPLADIVVHDSLLVVGQAPALHLDAGEAAAEVIRQRLTLVASTVVSTQSALEYVPPAGDDWKCAVNTVHTLLASPGGETGASLFQLTSPTGAEVRGTLGKQLTWTTSHSTAPGWKLLAKVTQPGGSDTGLATSLTQWNLLFGQDSGANDKSFPLRAWPTSPLAQPWELSLAQFDRDTLSKVGVELEVPGGGPPGCPVAQLSAPALVELDAVAIQGRRPAPPPGLLGGGGVAGTIRIDLNKQDLGAVLASSTLSAGTTVIASGQGLCTTSPITIRQAWIRLQFVQMPGKPLVLVPKERKQAGGETDALITVTQGGLDLQGACLALAPPGSRGALPRWLISAFDSDLVVRHCRLQGSLNDPGNQPRGLIQFRRLENSAPPRGRPFQAEPLAYLWIDDSQLLGNGRLVDADVAQRVIHLHRTVALSRNTLLALPVSETPGTEGVVDLSQCTLVAGETCLALDNPASGGTGQTRVQFYSDRCVFGPHPGLGNRDRPVTLFAAPGNLLRSSQVAWWEMLNGYATDVACLVRETDQTAERQDFASIWVARWSAGNCLSPLTGDDGVRWAKPLPTKPSELEDVEPAQFTLHANCQAAVWDGGTRPIGAPLDTVKIPTPRTALQLPTQSRLPGPGKSTNTQGGF